jgi:hypothetical protein
MTISKSQINPAARDTALNENTKEININRRWEWKPLIEAVQELSAMADVLNDPNTHPQQRESTEELFYEFACKLEERGALPYVLDGIKAMKAHLEDEPDKPYRITSPARVTFVKNGEYVADMPDGVIEKMEWAPCPGDWPDDYFMGRCVDDEDNTCQILVRFEQKLPDQADVDLLIQLATRQLEENKAPASKETHDDTKET